MGSVCIVVLCGLPASGKSTFCQQLPDCGLPYKFMVVEYDELLPAETEKLLIEDTSSGDQELAGLSPWKLYRQHVFDCADMLISLLKKSATDSNTVDSRCIDGPETELWRKFVDKYSLNDQHMWEDKRPVCVMIDDNMYYRSMRYSYYQLARKYNCGFCQIYLQTSMEAALAHNRLRLDNRVKDKTIKQMADRLEEPLRHGWEERTLTLTNTSDVDKVSVCLLIDQAMAHPIESLTGEDMEGKLESREICSASFLHQSDQVLRKLVSIEMGMAKDAGMEKAELSSTAVNLQSIRKQIIEDLREGRILVPEHVLHTITDASKDQSSDLYLYVRNLFCERKT